MATHRLGSYSWSPTSLGRVSTSSHPQPQACHFFQNTSIFCIRTPHHHIFSSSASLCGCKSAGVVFLNNRACHIILFVFSISNNLTTRSGQLAINNWRDGPFLEQWSTYPQGRRISRHGDRLRAVPGTSMPTPSTLLLCRGRPDC